MGLEGDSGDRWVFGYGSLMWRPGFPFIDRRTAVLHGRRRAFCIYSVHHRGTYERPGLVLGLAPGGAVRGVAYRVAAEARRVEVRVAGSTVTVRGRVGTWAERDAVRGVAWSSPGVTLVVDEMTVG